MTVQLTNQQRLQISAAASTLQPHVREPFGRSVLRALNSAPRPPSTNDVLMCIKQALSFVETKDVLISLSTTTLGEYDDYKYRKARY